jgi:hypothetical protein
MFIVGLGYQAVAQQSTLTFGEMPLRDLSMTTYEQDSSAAAVILNDFFKVSEKPGDGFIIERHVRIKILKEAGFAWADVNVPTYAYFPQFTLKAATHYLEDGKLVSITIPQESVIRQKISKSFYFHKFTFPLVRKGAVLEYTYSFKSLRYAGWQFQAPIPVRRCEFWAAMPNTGILHTHVQGNIKPTEYTFQETALTELYHWVFENVPKFKEEPMISSKRDYVGWISFSYLRSWEQLNADLVNNKFFYDQIHSNGFLKKFTGSLTHEVSDTLKKVDTLYRYVQNRYSRINAEPAILNLRETFEETAASSLEINMLLASMLDKIGLQSHIVLLSTRENGQIKKDFPDRMQFDYAVCGVKVNDQFILLDASEKNLPLGYLPEQFTNGEGFIVSSKIPGWIPLNFFPSSKTTVNATLKISGSETLTGTVSFSRDGYYGVDARNAFAKNDEWTFIRTFIKENLWEITQSVFENIQTPAKPMKDSYKVTIRGVENSAGDLLYVSPVVIGGMKTNPFTDNERLYPISLPANREFVYIASISVPESYSIEELPKGLVVRLKDSSAKFIYSVTQTGNVIQILYSLKHEKTLFQPQEYLELREFYNQVVAKQSEKIVLKKK